MLYGTTVACCGAAVFLRCKKHRMMDICETCLKDGHVKLVLQRGEALSLSLGSKYPTPGRGMLCSVVEASNRVGLLVLLLCGRHPVSKA